jgi:hypothetical protein
LLEFLSYARGRGIALAAAILALGAVYWLLVRDQDRREEA